MNAITVSKVLLMNIVNSLLLNNTRGQLWPGQGQNKTTNMYVVIEEGRENVRQQYMYLPWGCLLFIQLNVRVLSALTERMANAKGFWFI